MLFLSNCTCIETSDGFIYRTLIDGYIVNRPISYLKYFPYSKGERNINGKKYGRISSLPKCWDVVRKLKPNSIYYDDIRGCYMVGPDLANDNYKIWDPREKTKELFGRGCSNYIQEEHLGLISELSKQTCIHESKFGISGSVLVGLEDNYSDIDLLVYGRIEGIKLIKAFSSLDHPNIKPYKGELLSKLASRRKKGSVDGYSSAEAIKLEEGKTSGRYKGRHFNISIIREPSEVSVNQYKRIIPLGECLVECEVTNDAESIFVPPKYNVKVTKVFKGDKHAIKAQSINGSRFLHSQVAKEGQRILVKAILEKHIKMNQEEIFILSLDPWRINDGFIKPVTYIHQT